MKYPLAILMLFTVVGSVLAQDGWVLRESGTRKKLNSVSSFDGQNAVAIGESGVVTITSNGGKSWEVQPGINAVIRSVAAISDKIFCVCWAKRQRLPNYRWRAYRHGVRSHAKNDCKFLAEDIVFREMRAIAFDSTNRLLVAVGNRGEVDLFQGFRKKAGMRI